MRFKDKVALITAAASGIGRASAEIMARGGGGVVAVDKDEARLDDVVASLRATQGRVHGRKADALDPKQVDALVPEVAAEFGAIDILVNAVGGSTIIAKSNAPVEELSFADWQNLIAFNLEGTFLFCHAVTPTMNHHRRAKIATLVSTAGRGVTPTTSSASAAEPHLDRAHPPALGAALARAAGERDRAHAAAPRRRGDRPGEGDRLPR